MTYIDPKLIDDIKTYIAGPEELGTCDCGSPNAKACPECYEFVCYDCEDDDGLCHLCAVPDVGYCVALPGETMPWDR